MYPDSLHTAAATRHRRLAKAARKRPARSRRTPPAWHSPGRSADGPGLIVPGIPFPIRM
jgi:hypothetical protein